MAELAVSMEFFLKILRLLMISDEGTFRRELRKSTAS